MTTVALPDGRVLTSYGTTLPPGLAAVGVIGGADHATATRYEASAVGRGLPYVSLDVVAYFRERHPVPVSPLVNRVVPRIADQGAYAAEVAADRYKLRSAGVVDDGTQYGRTLSHAFSVRFTNGGESSRTVPPIYGPYYGAVTATSDLTPVVTQLLGNKVDCVFFGTEDATLAARLSRAAKERGLDVPHFGGEAVGVDAYVRVATPRYAEGDVHIPGLLPLDRMPRGKWFLDRYTNVRPASDPPERFVFADIKPDPIDAYAYDAATALARAVMRSGPKPEAVTKALRTMSFRGVTGVVGFDKDGAPLKPTTAVYEVSRGAWRPLDFSR
jgi:branched-chain amino acid transport system substrate-binding protein